MSAIKFITPALHEFCCPSCGHVMYRMRDGKFAEGGDPAAPAAGEDFDPDQQSEEIGGAPGGSACAYSLCDVNCTCGSRFAWVEARHMRGAMEPWKLHFLYDPWNRRGESLERLCELQSTRGSKVAPWTLEVLGRGAHKVHVHDWLALAPWTPDADELMRRALAVVRRVHAPMRALIDPA